MDLFIFGAGHEGSETFEDSTFYIPYAKKVICPVIPDKTIFVEDEPEISTAVVARNAYDVILEKKFKTFHKNRVELFGHITPFNVDYKRRLHESYRKVVWLNAVSGGAKILSINIAEGFNARHGSFVGQTASIGIQVKLNHYALVPYGAVIKAFSFIGAGSLLLANAHVGHSTHIMSNVNNSPA